MTRTQYNNYVKCMACTNNICYSDWLLLSFHTKNCFIKLCIRDLNPRRVIVVWGSYDIFFNNIYIICMYIMAYKSQLFENKTCRYIRDHIKNNPVCLYVTSNAFSILFYFLGKKKKDREFEYKYCVFLIEYSIFSFIIRFSSDVSYLLII